ncbi:MAG: hypothetical protein NTV38_07325 [Chloroflexi bacterium]|nr:hypothetical protein [Chloroflexota bacterium]
MDYLIEYGFALRVDTQGRPRIAYYEENVNHNVLYYAWSNALPLTAARGHSRRCCVNQNNEQASNDA